MSNIIDLRQYKINMGQCSPLYHAKMEFLNNVAQSEEGHCFICDCRIGGSVFGQTKAYRSLSGARELLCVKCFNDFKDTLDLRE